MMQVKQRVVIEPRREAGEPELSGPGLLLVNPLEARVAGDLAKEAGWHRYPTFPGALWAAPRGGGWIIGPALGAPVAAMALEKTIALGGEQVIAVGWCGALSPQLQVGDLLLPTLAVSEEGTSRHYPVAGPAVADPLLLERLASHLEEENQSLHLGPVWSTDAPYRECVEKVVAYREQGVMGVEMEFAALVQVAAFRGVPLAAVLLVSDMVAEEGAWQPEYRKINFKQRSRSLLKRLWQIVAP